MKAIVCVLATAVVALGSYPVAAGAQSCDSDLCQCLGAAGTKDIVAGDLKAKAGRVRYSGYTYAVPSSFDLDVCSVKATLAGIEDGETQVEGSLVLTNGLGTTAGKFRGYKVDRIPQEGVFIEGDLITGGGKLKGVESAAVLGSVDTTGSRPEVADCQQANAAVQAASTAWSTMSGQALGVLDVAPGKTHTLTARPGAHVFHAESIVLRSGRDSFGDVIGATLVIDFEDSTLSPRGTVDPNAPDPNAVPDPNEPIPLIIINVRNTLSVGRLGEIVAGAGATPGQIVFNLHGGRSRARVSTEGIVEVPIMAPLGRVSVAGFAETANLFANKIDLKGGTVSDALVCP